MLIKLEGLHYLQIQKQNKIFEQKTLKTLLIFDFLYKFLLYFNFRKIFKREVKIKHKYVYQGIRIIRSNPCQIFHDLFNIFLNITLHP